MSEGHLTSIIPRPGLIQTNTALLNGTYQIGNWDTSLDMSTAKGIFERCSALAPCLKKDETKILRHTVGLRPDRKGGPRVEAERISLPLIRSGGSLAPNVSQNAEEEPQELTIIHAYGMGYDHFPRIVRVLTFTFRAGGYQRSWGVAFEVLSLLKENV
jgi:D-amino-acid oxidase